MNNENKRYFLNSETIFGLKIGQIIGIILVLLSLFISYGNFAVRIASIESDNLQIQKEIVQMKYDIQINRDERIKQIESLRAENRSDHIMIGDKIDDIKTYLLKTKR